MAKVVLDVLRRYGYDQQSDRVFLQCFDDRTLRRLRSELKTPLPLIQLIGDNDWGEDTAADFNSMQTGEGLAEIAQYADGIGPWITQIYEGNDKSGSPVLSDLVEQAHQRGLVVHPYTFRQDELPEGIGSFEQLLDLFIDVAEVDGLFTDFPDLVVDYLQGREAQR